MALPAKVLVSRCWQAECYLFVNIKAMLLLCIVTT
jgi:hypothetical protein